MSWLSLLIEGAVSVLLIVMIGYCVRLNRLLGGLRERDAEIENLLLRFKDASDMAEASGIKLKAAGVEAERSVRVATERAETARHELDSLLERKKIGGEGPSSQRAAGNLPPPQAVPAATDGDDGPDGVYPPEFFETPDDSPPLLGVPRDLSRSEAELDLLRAIRAARVEG